MSETPMNLRSCISSYERVPHSAETVLFDRGSLPLHTHFRRMLRKVFSFELSSALSDTYASGLETVVASVVEAVVDAAGDALALFVDESREEGVVMLASKSLSRTLFQSNVQHSRIVAQRAVHELRESV